MHRPSTSDSPDFVDLGTGPILATQTQTIPWLPVANKKKYLVSSSLSTWNFDAIQLSSQITNWANWKVETIGQWGPGVTNCDCNDVLTEFRGEFTHEHTLNLINVVNFCGYKHTFHCLCGDCNTINWPRENDSIVDCFVNIFTGNPLPTATGHFADGQLLVMAVWGGVKWLRADREGTGNTQKQLTWRHWLLFIWCASAAYVRDLQEFFRSGGGGVWWAKMDKRTNA